MKYFHLSTLLKKINFNEREHFLSITVDELSSPTLKILHAMEILFYYKLTNVGTAIDNNQLEDFLWIYWTFLCYIKYYH